MSIAEKGKEKEEKRGLSLGLVFFVLCKGLI